MTGISPPSKIIIGTQPLRMEDILALASGHAQAELETNPIYRSKLTRSAQSLTNLWTQGETVYGVTTGVGDSCTTAIPSQFTADLPVNLVRLHGCGTGPLLTEEQSAAVIAVRIAALASGWSGVRVELLERLCQLLNLRILPCIPAQGSVGASGDLTPLSYLAAVLMGERECFFRDQIMPASEALQLAHVEPLRLLPKESLAIMNGTSVMTALGCLAYERARRLARLCAALTAMASDVLQGNPNHFDERIFAAKPHPGQRVCGRWIAGDIDYANRRDQAPSYARLQDPYSIRCAPHIIGTLLDALPFTRQILETEINGANDNPLVDPETGDILHGGNFYGGHVCHILDGLKVAVANLADLLDRQLALVCNPDSNHGLPANLVGCTGPDRMAHHGFKAMQITASALTAEALKLTMPASVFSRSTECHNQDKVSMGTIASRDCLAIIELTEAVAAINVLAMCQAVDLREQKGCYSRSRAMHQAVRSLIAKNSADRRQDGDIDQILKMYRHGLLPIGDLDFA